jgi:hypothetical protein
MRALQFGLACILGLTLTIPAEAMPRAGASKPPKKVGPVVETIDTSTQIDVNRIGMFVTNVGSFGFDLQNQLGGLFFPRGTDKTALFAGGLWLGAKVGGDIRVALAEYAQEYVPGPMVGGTFQEDSPDFRVFKVRRAAQPFKVNDPDTVGYGAWMSIAVPMGAPTDSTGLLPGVIGDQTLWAVYNDADPDAHGQVVTSDPLGVEVQQTTFAFDRQGALGNTLFMKFRIINKGADILDSMFVSLWSDPDLGGFTDDLVGIDVPRSLGYVYNASNNDDIYGTRPPALGMDYLQGPLADDNVTRLPVTAFVKYINGTDPSSRTQVYNYQLGLEANGAPLVNPSTGLVTTFQHSGDPVTGTGWLDTNPADRRMFLSSGPFTMAQNDTQEVVCAIVVGEGRDRLSAITGMRVFDDVAQDAFNRGFDLPTPPPQPVVIAQPLDREVLLTWGRDSETPDPVFGYEFQGYNVYQGATAQGPWEKIATFDINDLVDVVFDSVFDATSGTFVYVPVQVGTNSGLQYSFLVTQDAIRGGFLNNGTEYHFAVTAYNYNGSPLPKFPTSIENSQRVVSAIPQRPVIGSDLNAATADVPVQSQVTPVGTPTSDVVEVTVIDPTRVTGHDYQVFYTAIVGPPPIYEGQPVPIYWNLRDLTTNQVLLANQINRTGNEDYAIVDGLQVKVIGANAANELQDVKYVQSDGSNATRELVGFNWGGPKFDNGAGFAEGFHDLDGSVVFHSTLNPISNPSSFSTVEVRFSPTDPVGHQNAYRYLRDEVAVTGDAPSTGRKYQYGGFVDVPFTVWDTQGDLDSGNDIQLDAFYVERRLTAADGTIQPASAQFATFDSTWLPNRTLDGSREYLFIARSTYSATANPAYAVNDPFHAVSVSNPLAPLTYVVWPRKNTSVGGDPIDNGDMLRFIWSELPTTNDLFTFSTEAAVTGDVALAKSQLPGIRVVPNPYYSRSAYEQNQFSRVIRFMNLPAQCTIRIFTMAGSLVRTLEKNDPATSILDWDVQTSNDLPVASGIYLFQVESNGIGSATGRLVVFMEKERLNNF